MPTLKRALCRFSPAVVLGLGLAAIVLLSLSQTRVASSTRALPLAHRVAAVSPTGVITAVDRHLERHGVPFEARGMNYYPKDYAWDRLWISYTTALTQVNAELDLAQRLGVNTVRIFLPYAHFDGSAQAQAHLDHLADLIARLRARDMVAIVTLFDFYAGASPAPYSTPLHFTDTHHISTVINTLGITNPTVLAWDIKNELDREYDAFGETQVKDWAQEVISYVRELDPHHLVTIGFYGAATGTLCYDPTITDTLVYSPAIAAWSAPLVDFVSMHYFLSERCFESDLQALQAQIGDKPLVLEEFGLHSLADPQVPCDTNPGDPRCDDRHTEAEQTAYYNALLSLGEAYDVAGYLFWTLTDFSYILPDSQESHHCQGVLRNSLVHNCQVTGTRDYTAKPAADTVCRHFDDRAAYLDLCDAWVAPDTDAPPPGWSDNWSDGGALLRGYDLSEALWSHHPGQVAFAKFVTNGTSITGTAISPLLTNVNVDRFPILVGQVYSYSVRDGLWGSDAILYVGVQQGAQITRLLTITPESPIPNSFRIDLRRPPTRWSGSHNFQIVLELVPKSPDNGYSATYEFDWIGLERAVGDTVTTPLALPLDIRDTFGPRLLQPGKYSRYDFHRGIDLPAPKNTPVRAVTTGTVRAFRDDWESGTGSGNFVLLSHEAMGYETRYNHLVKVHCAITDGLQVLPGQIIGWVGDTGATYPHLHFEVRQGLTVTQRAAVHPLSTPFLPGWTNTATPTVTLRGVCADATGLTALVQVTSPYAEPDVTTVSVTVCGPVTDSRIIDYIDLNANTPVVADLDDPLVNDVCIIPADLTRENGYNVTMAFRRLGHGPTPTVMARAADVNDQGSTDTTRAVGGLSVKPPEQIARGAPGETVTLTYVLTNHTAITHTFILTHLSAQGWPSSVAPPTVTLGIGQDVTVSVEVTINTDRFGPPDCGLLVAETHSGTQQVAAGLGFDRIYRDAYVSSEIGDDDTGTGSMSAPLASISHGIDQTDAGGTVHVAQGKGYTENLTLLKTVHLLGGYEVPGWITRSFEAYSTTVNGTRSGAVLTIDGDYGPLVEGFTFYNGYRRDGAGGGVRLVGGAAPTLRANHILSNAADLSGGGIYVGAYGTLTPTMVNNVIVSNTSGSASGGGGGIYVTERPALIQGNVIRGNRAEHNGAGVYLTGGTAARLLGNYILGNKADDYGGGVLIRNSEAYLENNVVADNQAHERGSGLSIMGSSPRLLHTTIARNGSALPTAGGGDGSGIYVTNASSIYSTVAMTNTILVSQAVGITVTAGNTATLEATLWGTGTWANLTDWGGAGGIFTGTLNLWDHLDFVDPGPGDYHIGPSSAAIDAGIEAGVTGDIDGDPRPLGNGYDIGADELWVALALSKRATPDPVQAGAQLTFTLRITNTGDLTLSATITDLPPEHVTTTQALVWTSQVIPAPGGTWTKTVVVTVDLACVETLTNRVQVTTTEGATGTASVSVSVPPLAPALRSPGNGALISHATPTLTWQASPCPHAAGYLLDLDGLISDVGNITQTPTPVLADGVHTWTVAAYDALGHTSAYTDAWSFEVAAAAPTIIATAPTSGATDVHVTAPVVITFSQEINTGTFSYTTQPDPGGWAAAWSHAGTGVTLTHAPFVYLTTYTVTVTAANDLAGNPLSDAPYTWHFSTVAYRVYLPVMLKINTLSLDTGQSVLRSSSSSRSRLSISSSRPLYSRRCCNICPMARSGVIFSAPYISSIFSSLCAPILPPCNRDWRLVKG